MHKQISLNCVKQLCMTTQIDFGALSNKGCKFSVVSTSHLVELQAEIEMRREKGQFDAEFALKYMSRFKFTPPKELKNAKSIIVVAMPRPSTKAIFNWNGKSRLHSAADLHCLR